MRDREVLAVVQMYHEEQAHASSVPAAFLAAPFWCGDRERHLKKPYSGADCCCTNHVMGLPLHPATLQARPLTAVQAEFYSKYVTKSRDWVHLNKARQCGWTEEILRILAHESYRKYAGKKIGIMAGTKLSTSLQIFQRARELFWNLPGVVRNTRDYILLENGCEWYAVAANPEGFTGWTKFAAFLLDEAAKWDLVDDWPVINSILPIARTNMADIWMISTPKGPQKFFYFIEQDASSPFRKAVYDIWEGGRELYTEEQIREMIDTSTEDPRQEYLNQYVSGRDSIWGQLTDEDRTDRYAEARY